MSELACSWAFYPWRCAFALLRCSACGHPLSQCPVVSPTPHAREPPPKRDLPHLAQAYNIFQLAAVPKKRAQPAVTAAAKLPAAAKGADGQLV